MFKLFEEDNPYKVEKSLELLGIKDVPNQIIVLNEISNYLFDTKNDKGRKSEKTFDLNYDYRYYYVDFRRFGINLNKEDINWWEFNVLLEGIMLDEHSTMSKIMEYRTYKKPSKSTKTQESERHKFMMNMKRKYSLPIIQNSNGFNKLWNYLEQKVGENKE